ncbi:unnamed protein product [Alternaria alternata]
MMFADPIIESVRPEYQWKKQIAEPLHQQNYGARQGHGVQQGYVDQQDHGSNVAAMPDPAPQQFRTLPNFISGTPFTGWYDSLDPSYRTDPESCYMPGDYGIGGTTEPIEIVPVDASLQLRRESRIWFGKTYPIEKNVKAKDVGQVHPGHVGKLVKYWNDRHHGPDRRRVRKSKQPQKRRRTRDGKGTQAEWSVPDNESDQDEWNAQEMITRKETTMRTGEEMGDTGKLLKTKKPFNEGELLHKEGMQFHDLDEWLRLSNPQPHNNEDKELKLLTNAETHFMGFSDARIRGTLRAESSNIMKHSSAASGKVAATTLGSAASRWLQDVDYQLTGDLNSDYTVINNPRAFFKKGKVFMVPWPELSGDLVKGQTGPPVMVKIRRLVVVRPKATFCLCLPIHTYSGQATSKAGIAAQDHAPVVPEGGEAIYHKNEAKLTKSPMYIKVENPSTGSVSPMSRLNFGKVYTVEYNVKVRPIGRLIPDSLWRMEEYFMECLTPNTT